jgi:hypothetical protein
MTAAFGSPFSCVPYVWNAAFLSLPSSVSMSALGQNRDRFSGEWHVLKVLGHYRAGKGRKLPSLMRHPHVHGGPCNIES